MPKTNTAKAMAPKDHSLAFHAARNYLDTREPEVRKELQGRKRELNVQLTENAFVYLEAWAGSSMCYTQDQVAYLQEFLRIFPEIELKLAKPYKYSYVKGYRRDNGTTYRVRYSDPSFRKATIHGPDWQLEITEQMTARHMGTQFGDELVRRYIADQDAVSMYPLATLNILKHGEFKPWEYFYNIQAALADFTTDLYQVSRRASPAYKR